MPTDPIQNDLQQALEFHKSGNYAQAESIYRHVLQKDPSNPDALNLLGLLLSETGRLQQAVESLLAAVASNPAIAQFHANLGETYRRLGRFNLAADSLRRALQIDPSTPRVHNTLGVVLKSLNQPREATASFYQAVKLAPDFADAQFNLGLALSHARKFGESIAPLRRAVQLKPDDLDALRHLGTSLMYAGQLPEAEEILRSLRARKPDSAEAHNDLGCCFYQNGDLPQSIALCRKAIQIDPNLDAAHWNLAIALLRNGDLSAGWPHYEWRLKNYWSVLKTPFSQPRWDGADLSGKTILILCEQGFGDTIQFIRYIAPLAPRGGQIYLRCQKELIRLLTGYPNASKISADDDELPEFDVYCPLLSLPLMFQTTLSSIPADVPYLQPNSDLARSWAARLGPRKKLIRIGLAWAGSPKQRDNARRSMALEQFAPLLALPNIEFHSLQKGPAAAQAKEFPSLIDHANEIVDFADLAALISHLDLVISVDTAPAHLAGAMAKPAWVLLHTVSDWRWLMHRADCPWYPTMRLFRQNNPDHWNAVIDRLVDEVVYLSKQPRAT